MNSRWKKILTWIARISIFLLSIVTLRILFNIIQPRLLNIITSYTENEAREIKNTVPIVFGLLNLIISTVITKTIENKLSPPDNIPEIFITSQRNSPNNLSGIKRTPNIQNGLYIKLGEHRPQCRFVYAKIKNTGTSVIVQCLINKQRTDITLEPNQERKLTIVIFEPAPGERRIRTYDFPYQIQDICGNTYEGKYRMQIDRNLSQATFLPRKKTRKRVLGVALSDM